MLFLFSYVAEEGAPTRIRVGSHFDMARMLAPAEEAGMAHLLLEGVGAGRDIVLATGEAGRLPMSSVSDPRRTKAPRDGAAFHVVAPLGPAAPLRLERADGAHSPVEIAIREALQIS
jgi:hypothetical protein